MLMASATYIAFISLGARSWFGIYLQRALPVVMLAAAFQTRPQILIITDSPQAAEPTKTSTRETKIRIRRLGCFSSSCKVGKPEKCLSQKIVPRKSPSVPIRRQPISSQVAVCGYLVIVRPNSKGARMDGRYFRTWRQKKTLIFAESVCCLWAGKPPTTCLME
jgi:hypothetical protein